MKYYTGIGSRNTPLYLRDDINWLSLELEKKGYILRSGGADGADTFFEEKILTKNKQIYLPWKGFNNNESYLYNISDGALNIASKFHPNWNKLNQSVKKLMGRNSYQVLGHDLNTFSKFVVCYTNDGKDSGGTGQALRIARHYNIPIFNLYRHKAKDIIDNMQQLE